MEIVLFLCLFIYLYIYIFMSTQPVLFFWSKTIPEKGTLYQASLEGSGNFPRSNQTILWPDFYVQMGGKLCKKLCAIIRSDFFLFFKLGHYYLPYAKKALGQRHTHLNTHLNETHSFNFRRCYFGRAEMKDKKIMGWEKNCNFLFKENHQEKRTCHLGF